MQQSRKTVPIAVSSPISGVSSPITPIPVTKDGVHQRVVRPGYDWATRIDVQPSWTQATASAQQQQQHDRDELAGIHQVESDGYNEAAKVDSLRLRLSRLSTRARAAIAGCIVFFLIVSITRIVPGSLEATGIPSPPPEAPSEGQKSTIAAPTSTVKLPPKCNKACTWTWGDPSRVDGQSMRRREHMAVDLAAKSPYRRPQDLYVWSAVPATSPEGPGIRITISVKECCAFSANSPLAYFRITAFGRALAAVPPPFSLGPRPDSQGLGRGDQSRTNSPHHAEEDVDVHTASTFLLLPDAGAYRVQVRLTHWNVTQTMVSRNVKARKDCDLDPSVWVDGVVRGEKGEEQLITRITSENALTGEDTRPWCGSPEAESAAERVVQRMYDPRDNIPALPMVGRWVVQPGAPVQGAVVLTEEQLVSDELAHRDAEWLISRSRWEPYFCRIDYTLSAAEVFRRQRWIHTSGDSNGAKLVARGLCHNARALQIEAPSDVVVRQWDPPWFCVPRKLGNFVLGKDAAEPGFNLTSKSWISQFNTTCREICRLSLIFFYSIPLSVYSVTFDRWFSHSGKPNRWNSKPGYDWSFRAQCRLFPTKDLPINSNVLLHGWHGCTRIPESLQNLPHPRASYFSYGSHWFVTGDSESTRLMLQEDGPDGLGLRYYDLYPTVFGLTTAIDPTQIPLQFGRQQNLFNNERILGMNRRVMNQRRDAHRRAINAKLAASDDWILILDSFSPTYAILEHVTEDAVHFTDFLYQQWAMWVTHFFAHAPNFQQRRPQE